MSSVMLALGGIAGAVIALLVLRAAPRLTVIMWFMVLFFVPIWVGIQVGPFWSVITLLTVLAIATCMESIELTLVDGILAVFAALIIVQFALGLTSLSGMFIPLTEWFLPYVWGRIILTRVHLNFVVKTIALMAAATATLSIHEWITSTNYFVQIPPGDYAAFQTWATLQLRGDFIRVEGAFGHSIALGATLSMCAAFVIAARWHLFIRLTILTVLAGAVLMTLSRIALVTFVLTLTLAIIFLPGLSRAARILTGAAGAVAAMIVVPFISGVFLDAGDEAEGSAYYRVGLLSLVQILRPFGAARDVSGLTVGGDYLGFYAHSIDNAFMHTALRVGWVPTLLLATALVVVAISILRRRGANVAAIAVAGQIVSLFTVALITQYTVFFWFAVGLAVAIGVGSRSSHKQAFHTAGHVMNQTAEIGKRVSAGGYSSIGGRGKSD